ncbi:unnamed protein product, partial [Brassica oleracea]
MKSHVLGVWTLPFGGLISRKSTSRVFGSTSGWDRWRAECSIDFSRLLLCSKVAPVWVLAACSLGSCLWGCLVSASFC